MLKDCMQIDIDFASANNKSSEFNMAHCSKSSQQKRRSLKSFSYIVKSMWLCSCAALFLFCTSAIFADDKASATSNSTSNTTFSATSNINPNTSKIIIAKPSLDFQLGKHYKKLSDKVRASNDIKRFVEANNNQTKVAMFFSYACYWCSQLHKPFDTWALQHSSVKAQKFPVAFNRAWLTLAKAYFTAQVLDPSGNLDDNIFSGIHEHGLQLWEEKALEDFFASKGITKDKFKATMNSFDTDTKVKLADELSIAFEIDATPNVIVTGVKGAYITNLVMTRDKDILFAVIDYLVQKVSR